MNAEVRLKIEEVTSWNSEDRIQKTEGSFRVPRFVLRVGVLCVLHSALCLLANAQPFALNWATIDGGGGTSTGGVYSASGTIGQADAGGPMTNGQYSATGGFWVLPTAIQTEGAPTLTIIPDTPGNAKISWLPSTGTNWVLQERSSLDSGSWGDSSTTWTNPIVVPAAMPAKFYRLFKP